MSIKKFLILTSAVFFFLNLCLKFVFISSIPPILTNDELYYAKEAKILLMTGSDISGTWRPWLLTPANPIYSELTGTTTALGFIIFPNSLLLATKCIPIILGSMLPILLGFIVFRFTASKASFIVTICVATLNPWLFQFSRMGFDSLFSVSLYTLGVVILLYARGWKTCISLIPLTLGFYQYQGHKPLLLPLVILTTFYVIYEEYGFHFFKLQKIKAILPQLIIVVLCCSIVATYLLKLPTTSAASRVNETIFSASEEVATTVNSNRRLSFASPLASLFDNKYFVIVDKIEEKFFNSLNFRWLFSHGNDNVDTFAVTRFGFLYGIDSVLIFLAVYFSLSKRKFLHGIFFCASIVLIGTLPNVLKNEQLWLTFRGAFMIIGLALLSSFGLLYVLQFKKVLLSYFVVSLYLLSALFFFYHYFYQYPFKTTKDTFFYNRIVASYAFRRSHNNIVIFSNTPEQLFESILLYNNLIKPELIHEIKKSYENKSYTVENITVKSGCFDRSLLQNTDTVVLVDYRTLPCETKIVPQKTEEKRNEIIQISSVIDSGTQYDVFGDSLCTAAQLDTYPHIQTNVFNVENLDTYTFCKSFFTKKL